MFTATLGIARPALSQTEMQAQNPSFAFATRATEIARATRVSGRVVLSATGKPVAHVKMALLLRELRNEFGRPEPFFRYAGAETDAEGRYTFTSVPGERHFLVVLAGATDRYVARAESHGVSHSGKTMTQPDFALTTGTFLRGRVTDAATGRPLARTSVLVGRNSVLTDQEGNYRLCVLPGTSLKADAIRSPGGRAIYRMDSLSDDEMGSEQEAQTFDAENGQTVTLDFRCDKRRHLVPFGGIVTDAAGKPLPDVRIGVAVSMNPLMDSMEESAFRANNGGGVVSDKNGRWQVSDAIRGLSYHAVVGAGWKIVPPLREATAKLPAPVANIAVVVRRVPTLTVKGRVVTSNGVPLPDVQVTADGHSIDWFHARTDASGYYVIGPLDPSPLVSIVNATRDGFRRLSLPAPVKTGVTATAAADVALEAGDIAMAALSRTVRGRVVDAEGKPVAGARVWSPEADRREGATVTNMAGTFVLKGVAEATPGASPPVYLMAAEGRRAGVLPLMSGRSAEAPTITLRAPSAAGESDAAFGIRMAEDAFAAPHNEYTREFEHAVLDLLTTAAPKTATATSDSPSGKTVGRKASIFAAIARRRAYDPTLEAWCQSQLRAVPQTERSSIETELGLALAGTQPVAAARFCAAAEDDAPHRSNQTATQDSPWNNADQVNRNVLRFVLGQLPVGTGPLGEDRVDLSPVGAKHARPDQVAPQEKETRLRQYLNALGRSSAAFAPEMIDKVTRTEPDRFKRVVLFCRCTALWAESNPALARTYLKYLTAAIAAEPQPGFWERREQDTLTTRVALAMARTDFSGALTLLQTLPEEERTLPLARLAHAADAAGIHPEESARLWQFIRDHVATQLYNSPEELAWLAHLALPHSARLSADFFREAERDNAAMSHREAFRELSFLYYMTSVDPALVRERAEVIFADVRDQSSGSPPYSEMYDAALIMSAIDHTRGLAMLEETIKRADVDQHIESDRRGQIALAIFWLTPPSERFCLPPQWYDLPYEY